MQCKICKSSTMKYRKAKILSKYDIDYFQCPECGFIQTEEAYWLEEAYQESITDSDIGYVERNINDVRRTRSLISILFDSGGNFLDFAGGYGLFSRMMRDRGFNFYLMDKYCQNIFAKGFKIEQESNGTTYKLITAFEVLEHFTDPVKEIEYLLTLSANVFFSTCLIPNNSPPDDDWWYYGTEHGQHISLYSRASLQYIADSHGLFLYSNNSTHHLFTKKRIPPILFRLLISRKISTIINYLFKRKSLLSSDFQMLTGKHLS